MMTFKVLLIDDEPWALEGLKLWVHWEELGFEICATGANGVQGLKLMEQHMPDLVIVDIHMPVMDGLEMIKEWRERGNEVTKFVILTGYSDFDYARKALQYKASRYLLKPLDEEQAEQEIRSVLQELIEEQNQARIGKVVQREREIAMIKELLTGKQGAASDAEAVRSLSLMAQQWNVCLVQVPENQFARLSQLASEYLDGIDTIYLVQMRRDQFAIIFGDSGDDTNQERVGKRIEALARRLAGFRVFMALGAPKSSLAYIRASYLTASEALIHAFYELGDHGIIRYSRVHKHVFQPCLNQVELLERMLGAFRLLDHAGYQSVVDYIDQSFREARIQPDEARKFIVYVLHEIRAYMIAQIESNPELSTELFDIPDMNDPLLTFGDLTGMLRSCGRACLSLLLKEGAAEPQGIVQEINEYIHQHFREGLTIKRLAERFFLHPAYLGQLLMRKNGIGFNELLHNLRIEEACRLLKMNKYKNSEISEMVGYSSYNHFLKQFEKRQKVSPNEYKKI